MKDNFWVEEADGERAVPVRRKKKIVKRKIQFVGWASKQLIEFLESINEDTGKKQSKYDMVKIINRYATDRHLISRGNKKKIICDETLHALFGRKFLTNAKIHYLLEDHLAENHDQSDDEDSSEEESPEEKNASGLKTGSTGRSNKIPETPKSCFAAIIPENIKLVYLKKSLVEDLLKDPQNSETKVVGSFVRLKSDPNDIFQKHRFHLQQVTGVKNVLGTADAGSGICLRVTYCIDDIPISMLSDDNFSEEECEDLKDRVKSGLVKRPTVVELELKAQILHVDITKHWIPREISLLQTRIDHANEKGRRKELFEYLEQRKLLQTPSEQEKLLLRIPKVTAEELDPEGVQAGENPEGTSCSPKSLFRGNSDEFIKNTSEAGREHYGGFLDGVRAANVPDDQPSYFVQTKMPHCEPVISQDCGLMQVVDLGEDPQATPKKQVNAADRPSDFVQTEMKHYEPIFSGKSGMVQVVNLGEEGAQEKPEKQVIDLCNDESSTENPKDDGQFPDGGDYNAQLWHYVDPQGDIQGPFSLHMLKRWSDADYFYPGFTVWRVDQSPDDAVPLLNVLNQNYPIE